MWCRVLRILPFYSPGVCPAPLDFPPRGGGTRAERRAPQLRDPRDREAHERALALALGQGRDRAGAEPGAVPRQPRAAARPRRHPPAGLPAGALVRVAGGRRRRGGRSGRRPRDRGRAGAPRRPGRRRRRGRGCRRRPHGGDRRGLRRCAPRPGEGHSLARADPSADAHPHLRPAAFPRNREHPACRGRRPVRVGRG